MTENHGAAVEKNNSDPSAAAFSMSADTGEDQVCWVLTCLARREILRDAVFLWRTPFLAALSMTDLAALSCATAFSAPSATARRTSLDNVFDPGLNRFVPQTPTLVLAGPLQC